MNLFTGQQWRNRYREQTYGHGERGGEGEMYGKCNMETYITTHKIANGNLLQGSGNPNRALYQPRGVVWGERQEKVGKEFQKGGDICIPMAD